MNYEFLLPLLPISLGVPLQAEIIPFEPEQVRTCGGTKMPPGKYFGKEPLFNNKRRVMSDKLF